MTSEHPHPITVLDRLLAAKISEARARMHLAAGAVRVNNQVVSDPSAPAAPPARIVLNYNVPDRD
jgi:hypothetical protein